MKKLIAILLLICGCAWAQSAIFPSHLTIGPGRLPMQRGGVLEVAELRIPTDTDGLCQFFGWADYATGSWVDRITERAATQTTALLQPSVGTDSVIFSGNNYLVFSAPFSGNILASTIFARVKYCPPSFYDMVIGYGVSFTFCRYASGNKLLAQMNSGNAISTEDVITPGVWATYAMTNRDNVVSFFRNGVKIGDSVGSTLSTRSIPSYGIGNRPDEPSYGLKSPMKYLAVYNTGKTDSQIAAISAEIEGMP